MKEKDRLVLIGGGGHCKSVLDTAFRAQQFSEMIITDCDMPEGTVICDCVVAGTDVLLPELYRKGYKQAFITVGSIKSTRRRRRIKELAERIGFAFPTIIDPSAVAAVMTDIGKGVFIGKNAVVNTEAVIEDFAIINTGATVEHECHIGQFSHVAVGARVCGEVKIANDVFIGANATIIQGVKVGMNSIIGAGSVVLSDVPANTTVAGIWNRNGKKYE